MRVGFLFKRSLQQYIFVGILFLFLTLSFPLTAFASYPPPTLDSLIFDYKNNTLSGSGSCSGTIIYGEMYDANNFLYMSGNLNTNTNSLCEHGRYSFIFSFGYWGISRDKDLGLPNRLLIYNLDTSYPQGEDQPLETSFVRRVPAEPVTVTFSFPKDTHLRSLQGNHNYGEEQFMRIQSLDTNRSLVRYDQASLETSILGPVLSAKLRLTIIDNDNNWGSSGRTVDLHRLTSDWTEGNGTQQNRGIGFGATWNCATDNNIANIFKNCSGTTEWEMGPLSSPSLRPWVQIPSATQTITNNQTVVEYDVTSDVQSFLDGASINYGWIIKKTNELQSGRADFGTKESITPPELIVIYQP